jgi:carbamoyl-phosphate synthase large subunit
LGAGTILPVDGCVFMSVKDADKAAALELAQNLSGLGFTIMATGGTARHLSLAGLQVNQINKVMEGRPHCVDAILNGEVQLIINTTESAQAIADSYSIRRTALTDNIPHYTTITGARAAISAIEACRSFAAKDDAGGATGKFGMGGLEVAPLQSYSNNSA